MKTSRIGRRIAAGCAGALVIGAVAVGLAPVAAAKSYAVTIDKVALKSPGLAVEFTYSCDAGSRDWLVANATDVSINAGATGSAIVKTDKLVCDYNSHKTRVYLPPINGEFFKGSKAKVVLYYFDPETGYRSIEASATTVV
ncbi:hypothetical protein GCM10020221_01940 [Streptomyces thioluteus]|uniref:Uncharacterized protein n=1 Tax=Streptomyces thioluteus TaxID=66431 RepID=A0ABN3WAW3_STRTU